MSIFLYIYETHFNKCMYFFFLFISFAINYFSISDRFIDKHPPWNLWNVVLFFVIYYIAVNLHYLHVSLDLSEPVLCHVPVHLHLVKTSSRNVLV